MNQFDKFDNQNFHNFSIAVINSYFDLFNLFCKNKVSIEDNIIFINSFKPKTFVFGEIKDVEYIHHLQKKGPVYSIFKLPLEKESKFFEIVYDIDRVLDPKSYKNSKERYKKITYPFNFLEKNGLVLESISSENISEVKQLHDLWCEKKLSNPKTFKIMFSTNRYFKCCEYVLVNPDLYQGVCFKISDKIVGCRVFHIKNDYAYDLANFGNYWDYSHLMNYLNIYFVKYLKSNYNTKYFNLGNSLNTSLKSFKESLPSFEIFSYRYSKKNMEEKNTNANFFF